MTASYIKPEPGLPNFRWNEPARRYIAPNGQFVKVERVRRALDRNIVAATDNMKGLSQQLIDGTISLGQWQDEMMVLTKDVNLAGAALERGGFYQMSDADLFRVADKIAGEYEYLDNFANEIYDGTQRMDGTLPNRATLYGDQGRVTYHEFAAESADRDGMDQERSYTTPADHCDTCVSEEARGWVNRGDLISIGSRDCLSRCQCYMEYQSSTTGASRKV